VDGSAPDDGFERAAKNTASEDEKNLNLSAGSCISVVQTKPKIKETRSKTVARSDFVFFQPRYEVFRILSPSVFPFDPQS
jgi:hypothetical protein